MKLILTPVAKVLRQNVRSFSGHLKATSASQKQLVRLRILCSFRIWAQKFCVCFCSRVVRESLKGPKNSLGQHGCTEVSGHNVSSFLTCWNVFQTSEKLRVLTRILWSFRICTQKLCIYFCSRGVKESLKSLKIGFGWRINRFLLTPLHAFAKMLKFVGVSNFVENTLLYKMWYLT